MSHILFCHDDVDFAETRGELWGSRGHKVTVCGTVAQALDKISMGLGDISVIVLHKDFGDYSKESMGAERVLRALDNDENNSRIRKGYISGEFPDGKRHALSDKMDFYFPTALNWDNPWLLAQLNAGYVTDKELDLRGKEIATPTGYTGGPERGSLSDLMRIS